MDKKDIKVIFEDQAILVVDKPDGLVVNRAESVKGKTLQEQLEGYFDYRVGGGPGSRAGIVHRLDKETSGVLVVAKTDEVMDKMQAMFKAREIQKTYLALVHGFTTSEFEVKLSLARSRMNRLRHTVDAAGREAETRFQTQKRFELNPDLAVGLKKRLSKDFWKGYNRFSLVISMPKTGRTHQIRVHLHSVFAPIVGDETYGGRKFLRVDKLWAERMFLHAWKIRFVHPATGEEVEFESKLPEKLQNILAKLSAVEV